MLAGPASMSRGVDICRSLHRQRSAVNGARSPASAAHSLPGDLSRCLPARSTSSRPWSSGRTAAWLWSHREGVIAGWPRRQCMAQWIDDDARRSNSSGRMPGRRGAFGPCHDGCCAASSTMSDDMLVTTRDRTAFDLGRRGVDRRRRATRRVGQRDTIRAGRRRSWRGASGGAIAAAEIGAGFRTTRARSRRRKPGCACC